MREGSKGGVALTVWGLRNWKGLHYLVLRFLRAESKSAGDGEVGTQRAQQTPRCRQMQKGQHSMRLDKFIENGIIFLPNTTEDDKRSIAE